MTDITEKLRGLEVFLMDGGISPVGFEAAGEIDRLRADVERMTAENERLRTGLREAFEVYVNSEGFIHETAAEGYQQQIIKQMVDCINAALEGK